MLKVAQLFLLASAVAAGDVLKGHPDHREVKTVQLKQGGLGPVPLKLLGSTFDAVNSQAIGIEQSIVFFCVEWLDQCTDLREEFRIRGRTLSEKFNAKSVLAPRVRFAEVNCGEDKVLCNRQQVETYPTIALYVKGKRYKVWEGSLGAPRKKRHQSMIDWLHNHVGQEWQPLSAEDVEEDEEDDAASLVGQLRWAASLGAAIAVCIVMTRYLFELVQSAIATHRAAEGRTLEKTERKQTRAEARAAALAAANTPSCRMARRIPQDWAAQRGKIDL